MKLRKMGFIFGLCIMTISFMGCSNPTTKETETNTLVETVKETEEIVTESVSEQPEETLSVTEAESDSPTTESSNISIDENNILGVWTYEDELPSGTPRSLYLNVTAIDLDAMTIDMEYNFENYSDVEWYELNYSPKSDGVQTYKFEYYDDTQINIPLDDEASIYYMLAEKEESENIERKGSDNKSGFMFSFITEHIWLYHE